MPTEPRPPEPVRRTRADTLARDDFAWRARDAGATWQQAAEVSGYSNASNCQRAVSQAYGKLPSPDRENLRTLWRDRLEVLWRQALADALQKRSGAVTAAVRVEQAAAVLDGLNNPTEVVLHSPTQREISEWVAHVSSQSGHPVLTLEEYDILEDAASDDVPSTVPVPGASQRPTGWTV